LVPGTDGWLQSITDPAAERYSFTYEGDGLLKTVTDPRLFVRTFVYDLGSSRLIEHRDPTEAGGVMYLGRTPTSTGYEVGLTTILGRRTVYGVSRRQDDGWQLTTTFPDQTTSSLLIRRDRSTLLTLADQTSIDTTWGPDPRFWMQAPILASRTITVPATPSPLTMTVKQGRTVTLADPLDPVSALVSWSESFCINGDLATGCTTGRLYRMSYDPVTRRFSSTTPEARTASVTLNVASQPTGMQTADLSPLAVLYDTLGRVDILTRGTGPLARLFDLDYRAADGYLGTVKTPIPLVPGPGNETTTLDYDGAGRVNLVTRPDTFTIGLHADANGNTDTVTPPGRPVHELGHSAVDLLASYRSPLTPVGQKEREFGYNFDRQLNAYRRRDGRNVTLVYSPSTGKLGSMVRPGGGVSVTYVPATGKVDTVTAADATLTFVFDGILPRTVGWSGGINGAVGYGFDTSLRLRSQSVVGGTEILYGYDRDSVLASAGAMTATPYPTNGLLNTTALGVVSTSQQYDATGFGELSRFTTSGGGCAVYYESEYPLRDGLGRIRQRRERFADSACVLGLWKTFDYRYELAGRLEYVFEDGVQVPSTHMTRTVTART